MNADSSRQGARIDAGDAQHIGFAQQLFER